MKSLQLEEVEERRKIYGYNELPRGSSRSGFRVLLDLLKEPTLLLLLIAAIIYLFLGEISDGMFLMASVLVMLSISFYQENKAEKTLQSLRELSSPRAFVIRSGQEIRIPSRELVPDDIIVLHEGDRVPADAELLESKFLKTDESTLTGESLAVIKSPQDHPNLYLGSLVVGGHGTARVTSTGASTQLGKIGLSLDEISDERTPLQIKILQIVRPLAIVAALFCFFIAIAYGINFRDWLQGALSGVAAAVSLLPVEFPLVLAIFLSMGAWRISKRHVLARRLPAVESLGSITRLCVDKTGTLTQNLMTIQGLSVHGKTFDLTSADSLPEEFHPLVEYAALASHVDPFDPMDKAIWSTLRSLREPEHIHNDWQLIREYPLSDELRAMSCVWKSPTRSDYIVATKGAPETIMELCQLSDSEKAQQLRKVHELARQGYRILAVAQTQFSEDQLPGDQQAFPLSWVGLLAMEDPLRPEVPAAVKECNEAGIQVSMITGDYPETARQIGQKIGLPSHQALSGEELSKLDLQSHPEYVANVSVFARILPNQKLDIISALQRLGHIVAMTGDGVNDAPALRKADIGVAMGARGTDVAREASDLVLLDDQFASIVGAIRSGRRIFENIRKAFLFLLCIHVPIAGLAIIPVLLKMPLFLYPPHLVLLEMIIDPTCTLAFEAEEETENLMLHRPRKPQAPLLTLSEILRAFSLGVVGFVAAFTVYLVSLHSGASLDKSRTIAFATLIFWNLGAILYHRDPKGRLRVLLSVKNRILNRVLALTFVFLILIVKIPPVARLFHFTDLSLSEWLTSFAVGFLTITVSGFLSFAVQLQTGQRILASQH